MAITTVNVNTAVPVGKMLYVDSVYGNDSTGTPDRFDLPYLTLGAAKSAWTSGDEIVVRPGYYDERVMIGACAWHFELGAIKDYTGTETGNAFGDDLNNPATGKVSGYGIFRHSGTPDLENPTDGSGAYNGAVGFVNGDTHTHFECLDVEGRQGVANGAGAICFDSGTITLNIRGEVSSTIYDAFLAGTESIGDAVVRGYIRRIYVSETGDNAVESAGNDVDVTIEEVVSDNLSVVSLRTLGGNPQLRIGSITGGGINVSSGTIFGATITMASTSGDADGETARIASRLNGCRVIQTLSAKAAITVSAGAEIINTTVIAGAGATESIRSGGAVTLLAERSQISAAVNANVTVEGDLFYDDGTGSAGNVSTLNADGTWSWAAASGGGAVDSVNGQTGIVVLDASDVGADPAGSAAAAQAFAIQRANHTGTQLAATISDFNSAALAAAPAETTTTIGSLLNGATAKTTPVDADVMGLSDSAASNIWKKVTWANIKATLKAYFDTLYSPINTPVFMAYTGGSQANSTTTLQDVHASAAFTGLTAGIYELNMVIVHDSSGVANGAAFTLNGPAFNYLNTIVLYDVSSSQESFVQISYNWGSSSTTSRSTTNNRVSLTCRVRLTASGDLVLRFRSENAGQVITVTDVTGYIRRIG